MEITGDFKLGILGGGQLGRMLIQSAINFNVDCYVLDPDANAPCKDLSTVFSVGKLTDYDEVYAFGKDKDVLTIEIENVNTEAMQRLADEGVEVYPQPHIIQLIQDKGLQKQFYRDHHIPTADFHLLNSASDLAGHADFFPCVQKLRKEGYDGRGVCILKNSGDLSGAFDKPSLIEKWIDFEKEISVIVARNKRGDVSAFPVVELDFHPEQNLVEYLFSPADISSETEKKATDIALQVAEQLQIVGLLAVEMFVTKEGEILVNEMAPRTHNSGHQTIEANVTSQFEQHLRATLDLPLGSTAIKCPSVMVNLLGEAGHTGSARYEGLDEVLAVPGVSVHLYGKKITKPFRKMGHVTIVDEKMESAKEKAKFVKHTLKVIT